MSLSGKNICFTGALSMKRAEATTLATNAGANVQSGVSSKTNILISAGK